MRLIKNGGSVGITPDGPRGPRMHAADGAIALARLSGAPILPAAVSVGRRVVMNTWDRLIVALPYGEGAMVWGEPIFVTGASDPGVLRQQLETELTRVSAEADRLVGHAPIAPADRPGGCGKCARLISGGRTIRSPACSNPSATLPEASPRAAPLRAPLVRADIPVICVGNLTTAARARRPLPPQSSGA